VYVGTFESGELGKSWNADAWRLLGWVCVGKDGSIYLELLLGHPSMAKALSLPAAKQVTVKYQVLEEIPVPKVHECPSRFLGRSISETPFRRGNP
jgi:hypothetical protein